MHEQMCFLTALAVLLGAEHIVRGVEHFVISALQSAARIRAEYIRLFPRKKPPPTNNSLGRAAGVDCRGNIPA